MKKTNRKDLALATTTVRSWIRTVEGKDLAAIAGGAYALSIGCYTKPAGGCP